jgi:hypothetical protein
MSEPSGRMPPVEVRRDTKRDVLALVQAVIDGDDATFNAIRRDARHNDLLLPAALVLPADAPQEHGTNVAGWIAQKRQLLLKAEAHGIDEELPEP